MTLVMLAGRRFCQQKVERSKLNDSIKGSMMNFRLSFWMFVRTDRFSTKMVVARAV